MEAFRWPSTAAVEAATHDNKKIGGKNHVLRGESEDGPKLRAVVLALLGDQGPAGHSQILGDASSEQGRLDRGNGFANIRSARRGVEPAGEPTDPRRRQTRFAYRLLRQERHRGVRDLVRCDQGRLR